MRKLLFIVFILVLSSVHAQEKINKYYTAPLGIPMVLSGNFGELRSNHFHSGIDIKTQGKTGLPVFSVADGYVTRIKISPWGYGNALYINHPNGTTSVYGHLKAFSPKIQKYAKEKQYEQESFAIDISVPQKQLPVVKGQQIAYSGNSGSSGGPHLHFEIRDTQSEHPLNPLKYHFDIKDNISPKIISVLAYPVSNDAVVAGKTSDSRYSTVFYNESYHIKNNAVIPVYGTIGFGLQAIDYLNGSLNKCGIYSLNLKIDNVSVYSFCMNEFGFDESRYINSHADYNQKIRYRRNTYKTWIEPGNNLSIYNRKIGNGLHRFDDNKQHNIEYVVTDVYGNQSTLNFKVLAKKQSVNKKEEKGVTFYYDKENSIETPNIKVNFPKDCFYSNFIFNYKEKPNISGTFSKLYCLHNKYCPVHKYFSIKIKPENLPQHLEDKALLAYVNPENNKLSSLGGTFKNGWIEGKIRKLGYVTVTVDTIAPKIYSLSIKNGNLTESSQIRFKISDNFSGIESYRGTIDGKWVLFEYDAKRSRLSYRFDKERFEFG